MTRLATIALAFAAFAGLAATGALAFIYSGVYDVSALEQHTRPVYWALTRAMRASVRTYAAGVEPPPLDDRAMQEAGFRHYRRHCEQCHGAPGMAPDAAVLGMTPIPGYLVSAGREMPAREIYWIVKHGLKMTGMPAWKYRLSEDALWEVTAFVARGLPRLSPAGYREWAARNDMPIDLQALNRAVPPQALSGTGDPDRGRKALQQYACHGCHVIPGVIGADRHVGPPLAGMAVRRYIAGVLENSHENMVRWLMSPLSVDPLTAMPDMGLTARDAHDVAAYLATLRKP